jgi:hypothetical protein
MALMPEQSGPGEQRAALLPVVVMVLGLALVLVVVVVVLVLQALHWPAAVCC